VSELAQSPDVASGVFLSEALSIYDSRVGNTNSFRFFPNNRDRRFPRYF